MPHTAYEAMRKTLSSAVTWKYFTLRLICVCCLLYVVLFAIFKWHLSLRDTSVQPYTQGPAPSAGHHYQRQQQQQTLRSQIPQGQFKKNQRKQSLHRRDKSKRLKQQKQEPMQQKQRQQKLQQHRPKQPNKEQVNQNRKTTNNQRNKKENNRKNSDNKKQTRQEGEYKEQQQEKQQKKQQQESSRKLPKKQEGKKEKKQQQNRKQTREKEKELKQQQVKQQKKRQQEQQKENNKKPHQQEKEKKIQQDTTTASTTKSVVKPENTETQKQQIFIHQKHVAFVKTHKSASSTVLNILYRFSVKHELTLVLPVKGNYISGRYLNQSQLLPVPKGHVYDMLCNHAIFNFSSFSKFLPKDTVYVGIVREPYRRFISAFHYFKYTAKHKYLQEVPGHRGIVFQNYLANTSKYEPSDPMISMTNNRMAIDFGFPPTQFKSDGKFNEYLNHLNRTFTLVMVAELFDESLILLKRKLNWGFKDIMYVPKNRGRMNPFAYQSILNERKQDVERLVALDMKLYKFFHDKLVTEIKRAGEELHTEVKEFRKVRDKIQSFCGVRRGTGLVKVDIGRSQFSEGFTFRRPDCVLMQMDELHFLAWLTHTRKINIHRFGINEEYMTSLPN